MVLAVVDGFVMAVVNYAVEKKVLLMIAGAVLSYPVFSENFVANAVCTLAQTRKPWFVNEVEPTFVEDVMLWNINLEMVVANVASMYVKAKMKLFVVRISATLAVDVNP